MMYIWLMLCLRRRVKYVVYTACIYIRWIQINNFYTNHVLKRWSPQTAGHLDRWAPVTSIDWFIPSSDNLSHSEVSWAECSLNIGTSCWVQVFLSLILDSSVGFLWAFSLLVIRCLRLPRFESCIHQRKITCLLLIRISLACTRASILTTAQCRIRSFIKSQTM